MEGVTMGIRVCMQDTIQGTPNLRVGSNTRGLQCTLLCRIGFLCLVAWQMITSLYFNTSSSEKCSTFGDDPSLNDSSKSWNTFPITESKYAILKLLVLAQLILVITSYGFHLSSPQVVCTSHHTPFLTAFFPGPTAIHPCKWGANFQAP